MHDLFVELVVVIFVMLSVNNQYSTLYWTIVRMEINLYVIILFPCSYFEKYGEITDLYMPKVTVYHSNISGGFLLLFCTSMYSKYNLH